jgi:hypothetical protein
MLLVRDYWKQYSDNEEAVSIGCGLPCPPEATPAETLWSFCAKFTNSGDEDPLKWRLSASDEGCQAIVDINFFGGVTHSLQGGVCCDEQSAFEDTALRALWYLKCPGYENIFDATGAGAYEDSCRVPAQSAWAREGIGLTSDAPCDAQQRAAEHKTVLMRMQNRLQKTYSKMLPAGSSVWEWSYELSPATNSNSCAPPLCRATVKVAGMNQQFSGKWVRGQRQAQIDACSRIEEFLDACDKENRDA